MKFVRIYWNCAAALGTAVIIVTAGQKIIDGSQWLLSLLGGLAV